MQPSRLVDKKQFGERDEGNEREPKNLRKNLRKKLKENYYAWNKNSSFEICGMLDFLDNILKRNKPLTKNR